MLSVLPHGAPLPMALLTLSASLPVMHGGGGVLLSGPVPVSETVSVEFALN
jgi:hypothetical protein